MRIVTTFLTTLLLIGGGAAQANHHLDNVEPEDGIMVSIASVPVVPERQLKPRGEVKRSKSDPSISAPTYAPTLTPAPTTPAPTRRNKKSKKSHAPSGSPSGPPSGSPSGSPTDAPSDAPSDAPTDSPAPSLVPSLKPSLPPSDVPSSAPSFDPSSAPSFVPSSEPSSLPSSAPSSVPSLKPSFPPLFTQAGFEENLEGWAISGAEGSVDRLCAGDDFVKDPAGAPEGNCYARLTGTQTITRKFPLVGPGCVSFYFAWNEAENGCVGYNDFMRVSYVNEDGDSTTLVTLDVDNGDKSSWHKVAFRIPDAAIGSVLKFEGLVQNDKDTLFNSFLYLDDIVVSQGSCPHKR